MTSIMALCYGLILDVNQAFDGASAKVCTLFRCYILCMIRFLLYPKQDYYRPNLRYLKLEMGQNHQILDFKECHWDECHQPALIQVMSQTDVHGVLYGDFLEILIFRGSYPDTYI